MERKEETLSCAVLNKVIEDKLTEDILNETQKLEVSQILINLLNALEPGADQTLMAYGISSKIEGKISNRDLAKLRLLTDLSLLLDYPKHADPLDMIAQLSFAIINNIYPIATTSPECKVSPGTRQADEAKLRGEFVDLAKAQRQIEASNAYLVSKYLQTIPREATLVTPQFDKKFEKKYLDSFCKDSKEQLAAREIIRHTMKVTDKDFMDMVYELGKNLVVTLEGKTWFAGGLKSEKSNVWILNLLLRKFPKLADSLELSPSKVKDIDTAVFFDDAIYSGLQMGLFVRNFIVEWNPVDRKAKRYIYIVTPFISKQGKKQIRELADEAMERAPQLPNIQLEFLYKQEIKPLSKLSEPFAKLITQDYKLPDALSRDKYPLLLAHKMPDAQSSYPEVYSGYVPRLPKDATETCKQRDKPQFNAYLQGCVDVFNEEMRRIAKSAVDPYAWEYSRIQCPYPPYKPPILSGDELTKQVREKARKWISANALKEFL